MIKKQSDFLPFLDLMERGYRFAPSDHAWYRSRTDDVVVIEYDHKIILICLGTQPKWREWVWNIAFRTVEWLNMGRVHGGFARNVHELLGRADQHDSLLRRVLNADENLKDIQVLGHSRGFPLAALIGTELINHGVHKSRLLIVGCGAARVGNRRFRDEYNSMLGERTFVLNGNTDPVPLLPPWGCSIGRIAKIKIAIWKPKHRLNHYIEALTNERTGIPRANRTSDKRSNQAVSKQ